MRKTPLNKGSVRLKVKIPSGIESRKDFVEKFSALASEENILNPNLFDIREKSKSTDVYIDSRCGFFVRVRDKSLVRVHIGSITVSFYSFDYDSTHEWLNAIYNFVVGLLNKRVMIVTKTNRKGVSLNQKIFVGEKNKQYFVKLCGGAFPWMTLKGKQNFEKFFPSQENFKKSDS